MPREFGDDIVAFRESSIVIFLLAAAAAIQAVDYRLESVIMPTPTVPTNPVHSGTGDWNALAACSACDALSVFVPWQHHNAPLEPALHDLNREAKRHAEKHGKQWLLWVAASPSHRDRVVDAVRVAGQVGATRLILSDYGSLVEGSGFARLAPELAKGIAAVG